MADLRTNFLGIKSPNPFWLASRRQRTKSIMSFARSKRDGAALFGKRSVMVIPSSMCQARAMAPFMVLIAV